MKYFTDDTGLELTLTNFLNHYHYSIYDFYGRSGNRSFSRMKVDAGLTSDYECENEKMIAKRLPNLFHLNSATLLKFLLRYLEEGTVKNENEKLMLAMFYYSFYKEAPEKEGFRSIEEGLEAILKHREIKEEIGEILHYQYTEIDFVEINHDFSFPCPLQVHGHYSTSQILAAFGHYNENVSPAFREGVKYFENKNLDIFFITLNKSEKDFSPSTLYDDYAINERLFHWQTQSRVAPTSPTAKRYIHHKKNNHKIVLFVREYKKEHGYTSPFTFIGTAEYVSHSGSKPMSFVWRLNEEMPAKLVPVANKVSM